MGRREVELGGGGERRVGIKENDGGSRCRGGEFLEVGGKVGLVWKEEEEEKKKTRERGRGISCF